MRLLTGDCLALLKDVPDGSVDCVICDPPYQVLNRNNPAAKWDKALDMGLLWPELHRVCKHNAAMVFFSQGLFSAQMMMSNPKEYRYSLVWDKKNRPTGFLDANRRPLRIHEDIIVFYRAQPTYNPQMTYGVPCHQRGRAGIARSAKAKNRCYGTFEATEVKLTNEKYPTSIIPIDKEHSKFYHPTQKPVALLEWLVKTYTNEGETILDPTMGSGSTGVACVNAKRHFIGMELTEEFFNIARQRISEAEANKASRLDF